MGQVEATTLVSASPETVFVFHMDPNNLIRILPSYLKIEIVEAPPQLFHRARLVCIMFVGPLRFDWQIEISEFQHPHRFVDVQKEGPFRRYTHTHLFREEDGATRLTDVIEYDLPLPFTGLASRVGFQSRLQDVLAHGQRTTRSLLEGKSYA